MQAGYATGLLLLAPLADFVPCRPLLLALVTLSKLPAFAALTFLVGTTSIVPQVLVPLTADLAHTSRRAGAIGVV